MQRDKKKSEYQGLTVPEITGLPELPQGWVWTTVEQLGTIGEQTVLTGPFGTSLGREDFIATGVPVLTIGCMTDTGITLDKACFVSERKAASLSRYRLQPGDLLFSRMASVGRAGVVKDVLAGALINYHIMRLRLASNVLLPGFFLAYVRGSDQAEKYIKEVNHGATRDGINTEQLLAMPIVLPPLSEQHRIVAEVETQFTRLDAAVTALRRVQANLKRYRASVLQAACEGRLVPTEAELARAEGRSYELADQLLQRILQERRATWKAEQLAHMQAQGKVPKDERWKSKYKEPVKPETRTLPELPEGWVWTNLLTIAELKGGITKGQKRKSNDILHSVPYLRVANVQRGFLDLTDIKQIEATEDEIKELRLSPGDILFNEGGDRDKLGRGWVWRGEIANCIHQNHVFRARLYLQDVQPKFVSWYGNSCGQQYFMNEGKQTTNLASINLTKLGALPVPLPSLPEQHRIVAEVERRLSVIDELETAIAANLKRAERLRQAILKRAFEGKLVPQDPTDEPASVLLERIRAERAQPKATPKAPQKSASPPRTVQPATTTPVQGELALQYSA
jgi:type I restriction enzyme S subunit